MLGHTPHPTLFIVNLIHPKGTMAMLKNNTKKECENLILVF